MLSTRELFKAHTEDFGYFHGFFSFLVAKFNQLWILGHYGKPCDPPESSDDGLESMSCPLCRAWAAYEYLYE